MSLLKLADIHTLRCPVDGAARRYPFEGRDTRVARGRRYPGFSEGGIHINPEAVFRGVSGSAWSVRIGKYQVLDKWLRDRTARQLSPEEISRFQQVIAALEQLVELVPEIDLAIEQHGGFPAAFVSED